MLEGRNQLHISKRVTSPQAKNNRKLYLIHENCPVKRFHRYDDVFMSGNGRISEIIANWIIESGVEIGSSGFDSFLTDCRFYFPLSCRSEIICAHLAWQNFQTWSKNHSELKNLESAFVCLKHLKSEFDNKHIYVISYHWNSLETTKKPIITFLTILSSFLDNVTL